MNLEQLYEIKAKKFINYSVTPLELIESLKIELQQSGEKLANLFPE